MVDIAPHPPSYVYACEDEALNRTAPICQTHIETSKRTMSEPWTRGSNCVEKQFKPARIAHNYYYC